MKKYKQIFFITLLTGASLAANANEGLPPVDNIVSEQNDKTMKLEITINENSKIIMENVPTTGYLEVYNILGVKVTSVNLKNCTDGKKDLTLSKGLFILKAGKVAKKVIIK